MNRSFKVTESDVFGLIRPSIDVHTLGVSSVAKLLEKSGYSVVIGNAEIASAVAEISRLDNISLLKKWILDNNISHVGFSYRLDPKNAQINFGKVHHLLNSNKMFESQGGCVKQLFFAGLPEACELIENEYNGKISVFIGDETQLETLLKLGVPKERVPNEITQNSQYDQNLLDFGNKLITEGEYKYFSPIDRSGYSTYGTKNDTLVERIQYNKKICDLPLVRAHVGPYNPNYIEAKKEFNSWLKTLADTKFLDIVSVGSSQLSQSDFGTDWGNKPNGGGVPINSEQDLIDIWQAARPMLVRTYSSTRNVPQMAKVYEDTINIAWHALSLWWFNKIDGRGPNDVKENLHQHLEAMKFIASSQKPFEPNIPHHFSFRGADDYTYVLSSYLAAITAKKLGVNYFVLQTMLNTPKYTWGVQDLAKSRALLMLVKELESPNFKVFHQPRAGLDYFSPDLNKAKIQLAAVSAMMDDIDPTQGNSPDIIHVVSYCEAVKLADPIYINESIQITLKALESYRIEKKKGHMESMIENVEVKQRTSDLYHQVKSMVSILEKNIPNLYSANGLYEVFHKGVFAVPYLWEGREEFSEATKWNTSLINGSVQVVDEHEKPIKPEERMKLIFN